MHTRATYLAITHICDPDLGVTYANSNMQIIQSDQPVYLDHARCNALYCYQQHKSSAKFKHLVFHSDCQHFGSIDI